MYLRYPDEFQTEEWLRTLDRPQREAQVKVYFTHSYPITYEGEQQIYFNVIPAWFIHPEPDGRVLLPPPLKTSSFPSEDGFPEPEDEFF